MTEKKLFKNFLTAVVIIAAAFLALSFLADLIWGKNYVDTLRFSGSREAASYTIEGDGEIEIREAVFTPEGLSIRATGTREGFVTLTITNIEDPTEYTMKISSNGHIRNLTNGNSSAYQVHLLLIILAAVSLAAVLWVGFFRAVKYLRYSYQSIFYCGFGIWTTIVSLVLLALFAASPSVYTIYGTLQSSGWMFAFFTSPLLLLFCLALGISNIVLIRRESFRPSNALGILLSLVILVGFAIALFLNQRFFLGSDLQYRIFSFINEAYTAVFVLFECFLIGAIVCGTIAARHVPKSDVDFIMILGCGFRPDGTLYPLLQGRVDRAIELYRRQIARGAKAPVIVPSGGQGPDEPMSEAEAMRSYIVSKGIPESDILMEKKSRTTAENMRFSKQLIDEAMPDAKTAFSTTNYHVFRSGIISRQNGFAPEGIGSRTKWYFWPNAYVRECIGMIVYMKKHLLILIGILIAIYAFFKFGLRV